MYTEGHKAKGAKRLPLNLLDALRAFEKADVLREGLGEDLFASYLKLQPRRLERLFASPDRLGAADDARLLKRRVCQSARATSLCARSAIGARSPCAVHTRYPIEM